MVLDDWDWDSGGRSTETTTINVELIVLSERVFAPPPSPLGWSTRQESTRVLRDRFWNTVIGAESLNLSDSWLRTVLTADDWSVGNVSLSCISTPHMAGLPQLAR